MKNTWNKANALGLTATLICFSHVNGLARRFREDERGDVPGWVMITLMNRA